MSLMSCIKNDGSKYFSLTRHPEERSDEGSLKRMRYLMGTFLSIEVFHFDERKAGQAIELAFGEVRRIEKSLSRFNPYSKIFEINQSAHIKPQAIDGELFHLIQECLKASKVSTGAFDITVAPLMDLWSLAEKINSAPSQSQISDLLFNIGYQKVILDEEEKAVFFKNPYLKIDLGAAGKGYALDRAVKILKEEGIKRARLDFGGHLYYFDNSELDAEYIGIRNPMSCEEIIFSIPLENRSISTSANYERHFNIQGKRYGHIINPLSGFPVDNRIASVSVISPSALEADILSTAFFALGLDKGMQLIKNTNEAEAIIVTDNNGKPQLYFSQNYEGGGDAA